MRLIETSSDQNPSPVKVTPKVTRTFKSTKTTKTLKTTTLPMNEPNYLKEVGQLLQDTQLWAKVTGLVAVTGLMPNLLLHQLFFKEVKANNLILYREQVHSLNQPLNRLVTLFDAQRVMEMIAQLREDKKIKSLTQTKTGNEFNAYVARQVKEYLTVLGVDSFDELVKQYQSFLPSAPVLEEEIEIKDTSALIHTYTSTRTEFDRLMAQLGMETQHDTLVKILELANVALTKESEPTQLELKSQKDTEIAQLKEILISKDKKINRLSKTIASFESEVTQLQTQLTEASATQTQQETALLSSQQAHTELKSQNSFLHDEVQKLSALLQKKEQMIASLQTALANSSQFVTEQSVTQTSEPATSKPLSESVQLTKAMLTLTGVISKLSEQLTTNEKTTQNLTIPQLSQPRGIDQVSTIQKTTSKRSRSGSNERIEQVIAFVMQHNINSPHSQRWLISYTVLADLLGISLTPITAFFNDEKNQQLVNAIAQHHQDLGLNNNTHNRTYHPKQKITQFLKMPGGIAE